MLSSFKPALEKPLKPLATLLKNVNPNVITVMGLVFPVIFFLCITNGYYGLALVALAASGLDMLDGMIARANGKVTPFGGFLDSTIDRFADFVTLSAFGYAKLVSWEVVLPLLMLTYLISYMRSRTELAAQGKLTANVGIIERGERLVILFAGLLLYTVFPPRVLVDTDILRITFLLLIALSLVTVAQRLSFAYKKL